MKNKRKKKMTLYQTDQRTLKHWNTIFTTLSICGSYHDPNKRLLMCKITDAVQMNSILFNIFTKILRFKMKPGSHHRISLSEEKKSVESNRTNDPSKPVLIIQGVWPLGHPVPNS